MIDDTRVICSRAATGECTDICNHSDPHEPVYWKRLIDIRWQIISCSSRIQNCTAVTDKKVSCIPYNLVDRE